jgi:hypothetical protein
MTLAIQTAKAAWRSPVVNEGAIGIHGSGQRLGGGMHRVLGILAKYVILVPCSSICVWWAYSMSKQVGGGVLPLPEAIRLVVEMSLLTTTLAAIVWAAHPRIHRQGTWIGLAIKTTLETALILILYTAAVLFWRNEWTPGKGMSESAAFMPVIGHINAEFFSDFLWLEYLLVVVPLVSFLSGVLTVSFDVLQRRQQVKS